MSSPRASTTRKKTRIQKENEEKILNSALEVFSQHGFRGATIDQIAELSDMSKPNLLYYFENKETIIQKLVDKLLNIWLDPLRQINPDGEPLEEISSYIEKKLGLSKDFPRETRLFANEIFQGAPRIGDELSGLKKLVDEKVTVINGWIEAGKLAKCDPHHLIFSTWSTTQHYADFDVQISVILGTGKSRDCRFDDAREYLNMLFIRALKP